MNSKEALSDLFFLAIGDENHTKKCKETIEKDLKILDILKNESDSKRIIERDGIVSFHLDMILTTDNYNKIKDWLENE